MMKKKQQVMSKRLDAHDEKLQQLRAALPSDASESKVFQRKTGAGHIQRSALDFEHLTKKIKTEKDRRASNLFIKQLSYFPTLKDSYEGEEDEEHGVKFKALAKTLLTRANSLCAERSGIFLTKGIFEERHIVALVEH
ncbi:hypothetical protein M9H77_30428 [Catharanthus roseus]|uniref:Uncharacterized protein n=1 Tax=Catharanthus roseus TaxID=4058 RepID=A0ACB9ZY41_CATRO|nr:hypothetical protein M9H77_30428 [Catharanthus roseus]